MLPRRAGLFLATCLAVVPAATLRGGPLPPDDKAQAAGGKGALTDLYGDPLPEGALARLGTLRLRMKDRVGAVALSPDGKTVAAAGHDAVRLWDAATGKEVRRFEGPFGSVWHLAFSPDGKRLAFGGSGGAVHVWDVAGGKEVYRLPAKEQLVVGLAFSADGKTLAWSDDGKTIEFADAAAGKQVRQFEEEGGGAASVAFSPDGLLVACGGKGKVRLRKAATGEEVRQVRVDMAADLQVAFAPDSSFLAAWPSGGENVFRWDVATGRPLPPLGPVRGGIDCLAFAPDGKTLAVASHESASGWTVLRLQDVETRKERTFPVAGSRALCVAFSADGKTLAAGARGGAVALWDVATGRPRHDFARHRYEVKRLTYSADGRTVASAGCERDIFLWEAATGRLLRRFEVPQDDVWSVALSPDGKLLAAADRSNVIRLWDAQAGKELPALVGHERGTCAYDVAFAPDGKTLASAGGDKTVRLWDVAAGRQLRLLRGHEGAVSRIAFSPDGRSLVSESHDGTLRVWDLAADKEPCPSRVIHAWIKVGVCDTGRPSQSNALIFAPDGKAVLCGISADYKVEAFDVAAGRERPLFHEEVPPPTSFALSPDGRLLALGGRDGRILLVETATGKVRGRFAGHEGEVLPLAFSPDGRRLASGGKDTTVLIWDVGRLARQGHAADGPLSEKDLETLWNDLAGADAARAGRAVEALAAAPRPAVRLLQGKLRPVPAVTAEHLARLLADLDDDGFAARTKAAAELAGLAELAEPALRGKLAGPASPEARRRVEQLLDALEEQKGPRLSGERLRAWRSLEVLERIGDGEARHALKELAGGAPAAWLTREAQAALGRLDKTRP